jgi:RNA polymerase sigma factor (sigma-70 family)
MSTTLISPASDQELIALLERVSLQDQQALKRLYDLSCSRLYGLALRIVGRTEWAEDVLQEAFLTVWKSASEYKAGLSPPLAWMGLIVRSRALDLLRRQKSQRDETKTVELAPELSDTLAGNATDPMDDAMLSQEAFTLRQCLSRLEQRQKTVISMAYLRDLSHAELAASLELPLGTVKTWIRRGLEQLRICMARLS